MVQLLKPAPHESEKVNISPACKAGSTRREWSGLSGRPDGSHSLPPDSNRAATSQSLLLLQSSSALELGQRTDSLAPCSGQRRPLPARTADC